MCLTLTFKNSTFLCSIIAYCHGFDWSVKTLTSDITQGSYEVLDEGSHPFLSIPHFWHTFTFLVVSVALGFKIQTFLYRIITYYDGFYWSVWTLKSNITQASSKFDKVSCTCLSLNHFSWSFTSLVVSLAMSFKFQTFLCHMIAYYDGFDSSCWALKFDITRSSYELFYDGSRPSDLSLPHF
jgi:hypothetical protein